MRSLALALMVGCTDQTDVWLSKDAQALQEASIRMHSDYPTDALPWLRDIPEDSRLHEDAVLLQGYRRLPNPPLDALARIASSNGSEAEYATAKLALALGNGQPAEFYRQAPAWGLERQRLPILLRWLNESDGEGIIELAQAVRGDPNVEPDIMAWHLGSTNGSITAEESLDRLHPYLDDRPDLIDAWSVAWQLERSEQWREYLDVAPATADRSWVGIYRALDLLHDGAFTEALETIEAVDWTHDRRHDDNHTVVRAFALYNQVSWEPNSAWTPEHDEAYSAIDAWERLDRETIPDFVRESLESFAQAHGRSWAPTQQPAAVAWSLPKPTLPRHTTRVIVLDGPTVIPFVQSGLVWWCSGQDTLTERADDIASCVEHHLDDLDGTLDAQVEVSPEQEVTSSRGLGDCLASIPRDTQVSPRDWRIHVVDRRSGGRR